MDLTNLLNNQGWDDSDEGFSRGEIQQAMRRKTTRHVRKLFRWYRWSLLINLFFLMLFVVIYFMNPTTEFLVPILIITPSFLLTSLNLVAGLLTSPPIDPTADLKTVIEETLASDRRVHSRQRRYTTLILVSCFTGGFLLGLAFQGWTIQKYQEKPIIFLILVVLAVAFHFLTKTKRFYHYQKMLAPGYQKTKNYLEEQLRIISNDD